MGVIGKEQKWNSREMEMTEAVDGWVVRKKTGEAM